MSLKAREYPPKKILSTDFDFVIPQYQRPDAWGTEQALQLLDDLADALVRNVAEPYFLGSPVLVKPNEAAPRLDVIDGQQRLTTNSILISVLRDLAENDQVTVVLRDIVREPGVALDAIPATGFTLTTSVIMEPVWTPDVAERRQAELTATSAKEWELN